MPLCPKCSSGADVDSGFVSATLPYHSNWPHLQEQLRVQQLVWVRHLSCGSFGEVHELRGQTDDIRYAWKRVDMEGAQNLLRKRASTVKPDNEIKILGQLAHPNIVKLLRSWVLTWISLCFSRCARKTCSIGCSAKGRCAE